MWPWLAGAQGKVGSSVDTGHREAAAHGPALLPGAQRNRATGSRTCTINQALTWEMHLCPCLAHLHEVKSWPFGASALRPLRWWAALLSPTAPSAAPVWAQSPPAAKGILPRSPVLSRPQPPGQPAVLPASSSAGQRRPALPQGPLRPSPTPSTTSQLLLPTDPPCPGRLVCGSQAGPLPGQPCPHPTAGPSRAAEVTISPSPGSLSTPQSREPRAARCFQRPGRVHMRTLVEAPGHPPVVPSVPQRKPSGKKRGPGPHTSTDSGHKANSWDTAPEGRCAGCRLPYPRSRSFLGPEAVTHRKQGCCRYVRCGRSGEGGLVTGVL